MTRSIEVRACIEARRVIEVQIKREMSPHKHVFGPPWDAATELLDRVLRKNGIEPESIFADPGEAFSPYDPDWREP